MKSKLFAGLAFIFSILLSLSFLTYKDFFKEASSLGLLGLFLINFVSSAGFFISGPAFLTIISGGAIYSPLVVAIIAALGACLGDMVGYLLGHSGRRLTRQKLDRDPIIKFLDKQFHRHGALIIFLFAVIPNPLFDAIGILAGAVHYPPVRFFTIMLVGRLLRYWIFAQLGSKL